MQSITDRASTSPCSPGAGGSGARRTPTMQDRIAMERIARLRAACEAGAAEAAREAASRDARSAGRAGARARMMSGGGVAGAIGGRSPGRTPPGRPPGARAAGRGTPGSAALGEVNAQLAATAATTGQKTTTRLTEASPAKKKQMTPKERQVQERIARLKAAAEAGVAEAAKEAAAKEARERAKALARGGGRARMMAGSGVAGALGGATPPSARSPAVAAAATPPPQTVVLQPGEIDPTETTVITVQPPTASARQPTPPPAPKAPTPPRMPTPPRTIADPFATYDEPEDVCTPTRGGVAELDFSILNQPLPVCPPRPEAIAGLGSPGPRTPISAGFASDSPHPAFKAVSPVKTPRSVEGGACCQRLPQTTACPTPVRSVTARPISTNPNVSILEDTFDEGELLTEEDFGGGFGAEDFHLVRSAVGPSGRTITPPRTSPRPVRTPPSPFGLISEDLPRTPVTDIYEQIQRNKEAQEAMQVRRNQEFLRRSRLMREDDPARVTDRIMTGYYRATDPGFAECYRDDWDTGEVPVGDLLGDFDTGECIPCEEINQYSTELLEAMREPDFGPYGTELLSSNLQWTQPQASAQPGPYSRELFQNVNLLPTSGYAPGRYGSELLAHVDWAPPILPDPYAEDLLLGDLPCPPPPPTDPCDIADLIDW